MNYSVFGTKPTDSIYMSDVPYAVRWNCKSGGLFVGGFEEENRRSKPSDKVEISIIKASRYFGNLGTTTDEQWLQLFYVAAPICKFLPKNQVCVSYLKKQSINNLMLTVSDAMESGDPGRGVFIGRFEKQAGEKGTYYTVAFDWRERNGEAETKQANMLYAFMQSQPALVDLNGTRDMICIQGKSAMEILQIVEGAKLNRSLGGSNLPQLPAA